MKILILAAMQKEINLLIDLLEETKVEEIRGYQLFSGNLYKHEIIISKCGIGKVNSALNTYRLIQEFHPDLVVNSGVAGGAGVGVGTTLIASEVAYHDVWCGPGTVYGQADGFPLFMHPSERILELASGLNLEKGLICSGDKFISTPEEIEFIRLKFPDVKAIDMESASIAQTCLFCGTSFAILRVVSDTPGEGENISQYKDFWATAPVKTFNVVKEIIKNL